MIVGFKNNSVEKFSSVLLNFCSFTQLYISIENEINASCSMAIRIFERVTSKESK